MGLFRSDEIIHKKLRIPRDNCLEIMEGLGELHNTLEFIDLNIENIEGKKYFIDSIIRCDIIEKKIRKIFKIFEDFDQKIFKIRNYEYFQNALKLDKLNHSGYFGTYFDYVENYFTENENKLLDLVNSFERIKENLEELIDKKFVWDKTYQLITNNSENLSVNIEFNQFDENREYNLQIIGGVIDAEDEIKFKRLIFRITRGLAYPNIFDLEYEIKSNEIIKAKKKIFVIFIQGQGLLLQKVLKVCDLIRASRFNIPLKIEFFEKIQNLANEIQEKKTFLKETENTIRNFLNDKDDQNKLHKNLNFYKIFLQREKLIYNNLNKCIIRDSFVDGEIWILKNKLSLLKDFLNNYSHNNEMGSTACLIDLQPTHMIPPTFLDSNDFTKPFQEIVNTFSIPNYREINPACFTIVTFPFLFGVMFGDMGHGLILILFSLFIFIYQKKIRFSKNSFLQPFFEFRFILLMFGFFSFYSGLMYNEFFSIPIPIFGSCYEFIDENSDVLTRIENCVYPVGVDPKWNISKNELNFINSMKMKLSIILGLLHMLLGIILSGFNFLKKKEYTNIFFVFIPKLIFMCVLFGYLCVMIIIKWVTDWKKVQMTPPVLINQFLNIFLKGGVIVYKYYFILDRYAIIRKKRRRRPIPRKGTFSNFNNCINFNSYFMDSKTCDFIL